MQSQPDLFHPVPDRGHQISGLAFGHTMHDHIVGLCRPVDYADRGVKVLVGEERWVEWSA
jgi:hypothetical protein